MCTYTDTLVGSFSLKTKLLGGIFEEKVHAKDDPKWKYTHNEVLVFVRVLTFSSHLVCKTYVIYGVNGKYNEFLGNKILCQKSATLHIIWGYWLLLNFSVILAPHPPAKEHLALQPFVHIFGTCWILHCFFFFFLNVDCNLLNWYCNPWFEKHWRSHRFGSFSSFYSSSSSRGSLPLNHWGIWWEWFSLLWRSKTGPLLYQEVQGP